MFKLKADPTFEAPVEIPSPNGPQTITLVFRHKTRKEMKTYFEQAAAGELGDDTQAVMGLVVDWKDADEPFSAEAVTSLVENYFGAVPAIFSAYIAALAQAKQGN